MIDFWELVVRGWNIRGVAGLVLLKADIPGEIKLSAIICRLCGRILRKCLNLEAMMIEDP